MKNKYKIVIAIGVVALLIVSSLVVYFIYAKKQEKNYTHIVCKSYNRICQLDFGYVKNAKVNNYSTNYRMTEIRVPDIQSFIDNNVKTHENYKTTRLDVDGNEEIILVKDGYVFTLIYSEENQYIKMYDNFGNCNDYLFPFLAINKDLIDCDENYNLIYEKIITYEELNYSIYNKKYNENKFIDYETIKQFYLENYVSDMFIANDELKTIQLKVAKWHYYDGWSNDYPIEIICRENDIFLHTLREL